MLNSSSIAYACLTVDALSSNIRIAIVVNIFFLPALSCWVGLPSSFKTLTAKPSSLIPSSKRYGNAISIERSDLPSV